MQSNLPIYHAYRENALFCVIQLLKTLERTIANQIKSCSLGKKKIIRCCIFKISCDRLSSAFDVTSYAFLAR